MNSLIKLSQLKINEYAVIEKIDIFTSMRRRLQDLGIVNGTIIKCVFFNRCGSITAYKVRGATIALRKNDTDCIYVRPIKRR